MKLTYSLASIAGPRKTNQDAAVAEPDLGLFAVADGMGGYAGGEIASALSIEALREIVRRDSADDEVTLPFALQPSVDPLPGLLAVGLRYADQKVRQRRQGAIANMGSTLVAVLIRSGRAALAHVGDSRAYALRAGTLEQLTIDHSLYEELRRQGSSSLPPIDEFPYANVITRAIGGESDPEVATVELKPGTRLLLCSDGLTGALADEAITEIIGQTPVARAAGFLVEAAEANATDNVTALVVGVEESSS